MSFLPYLQKIEQKRSIRFSNPLNGVVFDNQSYLKKSDIEIPIEDIPQQPRYHKKTKSSLQERQLMTRRKFKLNRELSFFRNSTLSQEYETKRSSLGSSKKKKKSPYNDVEVRVIQQIESGKIKQQKVVVNFGYFFNTFFRKNINIEEINEEFLDFVEGYIRKIVQENKLRIPLNMDSFPEELFHLKGKQKIIQKIEMLEERKAFRSIEAVIRFYCIPSKEYRESCLRDILLMILKELEKKYDFDRKKTYVLVNLHGKVIRDMSQIYFSTKTLILCSQEHHQRIFRKFTKKQIDNQIIMKKMDFSEGLKKSFRSTIAKGNFENYLNKEYKTIETAFEKRKQAEKIINSKRSFMSMGLYDSGLGKSRSKRKDQLKVKQQPKLNKYEEQFNKYKKNDENKISLNQLIDKSNLFKNKSEEHINKILMSLGISPEVINFQTQNQYIDFYDWVRMKEISECEGQRLLILLFLKKFMSFGKNRRLKKSQFSSMMKIIRKKTDRQTLEEGIWLWFERNNMIEDYCLMERQLIDEWKDKNKCIIELLVSLIFGIKEHTIIDMIYQILI